MCRMQAGSIGKVFYASYVVAATAYCKFTYKTDIKMNLMLKGLINFTGVGLLLFLTGCHRDSDETAEGLLQHTQDSLAELRIDSAYQKIKSD
jgi:hypothetical protein